MILYMCDTFVRNAGIQAAGQGRESSAALFGKNSDRHPDEPQMLFAGPADLNKWEGESEQALDKYTDGPLQALRRIYDQYEHPYRALISKPVWMWGGEMGLNERGVAIGNEAVFSKWRSTRNRDLNKGLLGMDLLRLALHNAATAREAVEFLSRTIEREGQGGDGAYKGHLYYDNSFLICDARQAFILETADHRWAVKQVTSDAISNCYILQDDFEACDQISSQAAFRPSGGGAPQSSRFSFAEHNESKLYRWITRGRARRRRARQLIDSERFTLESAFQLLRDHNGRAKPGKGMGSLCMHSGALIKSQTTGSMVVEFQADGPVAWVTGSPHPCVSLFQPWSFDAFIPETEEGDTYSEHLLAVGPVFRSYQLGEEYSRKMRQLSQKLADDFTVFAQKHLPERERVEALLKQTVSEGIAAGERSAAIEKCRRIAYKYLKKTEEAAANG